MSKLDEILAKRKTVVPVLDLSRNVVQTKDELKRLMERVPDYKMRPIKVKKEEIKLKEQDFSFKTPKKELRKLTKSNGEREATYIYTDPVPAEMREVSVMELCVVPIDWRMLTTLRPKSKSEEEYFSRMTEMGKQQIKTNIRDRRVFQLSSYVKKTKNKSGVVETKLITCNECGQDMCCGKSCMDFSYDLFARAEPKIQKPKHCNYSNKDKTNGRKVKDGNKYRIKKSANRKAINSEDDIKLKRGI